MDGRCPTGELSAFRPAAVAASQPPHYWTLHLNLTRPLRIQPLVHHLILRDIGTDADCTYHGS